MGKKAATVPDNTQLLELTDQTVLRNVERRYMENDIYTFTGSILLAVNPYERLPIYDEKFMERFPGKPISKNEPHVFASGEEAYQRIRKDRRSQSVVVSARRRRQDGDKQVSHEVLSVAEPGRQGRRRRRRSGDGDPHRTRSWRRLATRRPAGTTTRPVLASLFGSTSTRRAAWAVR